MLLQLPRARALLLAILLAGCSSAPTNSSDPAPANAQSFTYRCTGLKGQPGVLTDD
jgi:PBP1b-binding outer membrane lipoprotein LpoB